MSGYLSRIVQTAARPNRELRPLAGSVFGAPAENAQPSRLNDAPFAVETAAPAASPDASTPQRGAAGAPWSAAPGSILEHYRPLQPRQPPLAQTFTQPRQGSRASFESSRIQPQDQPPAPETNQADASPRASEIPSATAPLADSIASQTDKQAFESRIAPRSESAPIADGLDRRREQAESSLGAQPSGSDRTQVVALPSLVPGLPRQTVRPQQPPIRDLRAAPAPQAGIEIHIGRIEVLAAQPPAPPAPAPRQDRTTSLADYLAGRNGRRS